MQTFLGIHHAGLSVANLEESIRWYIDKLGFEEDFRYEFPPQMNTKAAFLKMGDFRIELFEVAGSKPMPRDRTEFSGDLHIHGMKHMALRVADIDKARAELEAKGVEFVMPTGDVPNSDGERYAFFHDNNKILIELYQPVKP